MRKPFISVIIDNYNYARFIPDAIQSVLTQKEFTDFEIIIVDDASTDQSRRVIEAYQKQDKITTLFLPANRGQGYAFNAGFQLSQGDWICFLDSDDIFFEDKLRHVAEAATTNPHAFLIYNQGHYADKNLNIGEVFPKQLPEGNLSKLLYKTSETLLPPTSFLSFNRKFLKKVLPMDPFLTRIDADFPLQIWAAAMGDVVAIKKPLGLYRLHGNNWFTNDDFLKLDLDMLQHLMLRTEKAFYYINSRVGELGIQPIELMRQRFYLRNLFIFGHINFINYLAFTLANGNFVNFRDKWQFFKFGMERRKRFITQKAIEC
ncbi:glycosyltransferase [Legionella beliardensis]|uniref:Glycosyltransferase n=2 Tax=Legionella beliardensis TaxID=91822 RepID=A0A378I0P9_9GAMM|nr:glycosyltransferase [Legionella beliardensis]